MQAEMTALYIRLSMEDRDLSPEKRESISIRNQREYLRNYLKENTDIAAGSSREFIEMITLSLIQLLHKGHRTTSQSHIFKYGTGGGGNPAFLFHRKFRQIPYEIKSPPGRIALRRK